MCQLVILVFLSFYQMRAISCHFADSKGRFSPIRVPAVEVTPRTEYTCDIGGMIPDYEGVIAGLSLIAIIVVWHV